MKTFSSSDVGPLIHGLQAFIGLDRVKEAVAGWQRSVDNSRGLVKHYHAEHTFPWWRAFEEFWRAEHIGPGSLSFVTANVIALAKDALKLLELLPNMPDSIRQKYSSALGSRENAPSHFFEIAMAHHFLTLGYEITWCEATGKKLPEFIVKAPNFNFEVECKQISVDKGRRIIRRDFYQLYDLISEGVRQLGMMGTIRVELTTNLPKQYPELVAIADAILQLIKRGIHNGTTQLRGRGSVTLQIEKADNVVIDFSAAEAAFRAGNPQNVHGAIMAQPNSEVQAINALAISVTCLRDDEFLSAVIATLKVASVSQLSGQHPGVLCVFIPEIDDFEALSKGSGLEATAATLFERAGRDHLAGIVFASHGRVTRHATGAQLSAAALAYSNPTCRFEEVRGNRFLSR